MSGIYISDIFFTFHKTLIMKTFLITALLITPLLNYAQYEIKGSTSVHENGKKIYLKKLIEEELTTIDSAQVNHQQFYFKGDKIDTQLAYLEFSSDNEVPIIQTFILENGTIQVFIESNNIKFSGTKNNEDFNKFNENVATISKEITDFQNANMEKFQTAAVKNDTQTLESLISEIETLQNKIVNEANTFIDNNKDSYVSLLLLTPYGNQLTDEEFKTKYNNLSTEIKQTKIGKEIASQIRKKEALAIGMKAPDFKAKTPKGKEISLYENLSKITIIDFWASWCGPCRQENPAVVKLYTKYKKKGLQIIGVSLDKDESKWKKAIADDKLTWIQISNLQFWKDPIAKLYNVESIPSVYILDQKGTIIAKDLRGAELEAKIAELLK